MNIIIKNILLLKNYGIYYFKIVFIKKISIFYINIFGYAFVCKINMAEFSSGQNSRCVRVWGFLLNAFFWISYGWIFQWSKSSYVHACGYFFWNAIFGEFRSMNFPVVKILLCANVWIFLLKPKVFEFRMSEFSSGQNPRMCTLMGISIENFKICVFCVSEFSHVQNPRMCTRMGISFYKLIYKYIGAYTLMI